MIVTAALQEDVDVVGISILSGAHMTIFPRVFSLMQERGMDDVIVVAGGVIQEEDRPKLRQLGVADIFDADATTQDLIDGINRLVQERGTDDRRSA